MMMGMLAVLGSRRRLLQTSKPSTSGSMTSSRTRAGRVARAFSKACRPLAALSTSKPAPFKLTSINSRASGSSSTTRIFVFIGSGQLLPHRTRPGKANSPCRGLFSSAPAGRGLCASGSFVAAFGRLKLGRAGGVGERLHLADGDLIEPLQSFSVEQSHVDELGVHALDIGQHQ